jgi:hypothetical protein
MVPDIMACPDNITGAMEWWTLGQSPGRDGQVSRRNAGLVRARQASVFNSRKTTDTSSSTVLVVVLVDEMKVIYWAGPFIR